MTITMPEIDAATKQLVADLQTARDLIDEHGLVKEMFVAFGGGYCAVGAINKATAGGATMYFSVRARRACDAVADTLGYVSDGEGDEELQRRCAIYDFNDSPLTEKADVLSLLDVTIAGLSA